MWSGLYSLVPWPHFSVAVHWLDYSHCEQEALDSEFWSVYHSTANVANLGNVQIFDAKWNQLESTGWDCHHNLVGWGTFLGLRQKKNIEYHLLTFKVKALISEILGNKREKIMVLLYVWKQMEDICQINSWQDFFCSLCHARLSKTTC